MSQKVKVLVIDDEKEKRDNALKNLEEMGYEPHAFVPSVVDFTVKLALVKEELAEYIKEHGPFKFALVDGDTWGVVKGYQLLPVLIDRGVAAIGFSGSIMKNDDLEREGAVACIFKDDRALGDGAIMKERIISVLEKTGLIH